MALMNSFAHRHAASAVLVAAALAACSTRAQQLAPAPVAAAPAPASAGPALTVGSAAPEFVLRGATRYGLLETPVRLSDYRGQTVVIAFFYKARTKG
jgi:hypothetical protein